MPNRYTFKLKTVKELLQEEMAGLWLDPFCGKGSPARIRNDADRALDAECHMDGLKFLRAFHDETVHGVLFDPPYSVDQALRKYTPIQKGTAGRAEYWAKCKNEVARVIRIGGKAVCFGWDSTGVGKKRGFQLVRLILICHGACHNDTIVTVEQKYNAPSIPL